MKHSRLMPDYSADSLFTKAVAHQQSGRSAEAEAIYLSLLNAFPGHFDVAHNLGRIFLSSGRFQEALAVWNQVGSLFPHAPKPFLEKALIYLAQGDRSLAEEALVEAARFAADDITWRHIAGVYVKLHRYDLAVDASQHALELGPGDAENYCGFASLCNELGDYVLAADIARAAIKLNPDAEDGWLELGNALMHQSKLLEAAEIFTHAADLCSESPDAYCSLGLIRQQEMRLDEAISYFDKAIALDCCHETARWNRALALLAQGKFKEAWPDYELRHGTAVQIVQIFPPYPEWKGEVLVGKTILLIHEQGLGDSLQFIRYARQLKEQGARVWVRVPEPLVRLFQQADGVDTAFSDRSDFPGEVDCYSLLLSLPLRFGTTLETIPARIPYLFPNAAEIKFWQDKLTTLKHPRVGLVWAGGERRHNAASNRLNQRRNLPLSMLAPIINHEHISFVSLQLGGAEAEIAAGNFCHRIADFSHLLHDMASTAALIGNLDLVIGVDTSVIHLAGALGKPTWMLNRFDTDWRWMVDGRGSPWYPSLRQFRQALPGNWEAPILEISQNLVEWSTTP